MSRPEPKSVRRVSCVGAGLMGSGWAAHFLRAGLDVVAYDPAPAAESTTRRLVELAWPTLERLGLARGASIDRLSFTTDLKRAVQDAELVQESAFEDEPLKIKLLAEVDRIAAPEAVIASSSSGFLASRLRSGCARGGRVLVAHPFNPPYLIPLVEIVGGEGADAGAVAWAHKFYRGVGSHPIVLGKDIANYVGNRLQYAIMRELYHLVAEDVASVEDIDDALTYGPALRWAYKGPCAIFHMGVQRPAQYPDFLDGMGREIDSGRALAPEGPAMRPGVRDRIVREMTAAAAGKSHDQLMRERDEAIVRLRLAREGGGER
ncbi:MAG: 3-hydroxyacyl-CoA dehydrogenase NAD-binding domain-containing protein [Alphaproteobacteria bacterium]